MRRGKDQPPVHHAYLLRSSPDSSPLLHSSPSQSFPLRSFFFHLLLFSIQFHLLGHLLFGYPSLSSPFFISALSPASASTPYLLLSPSLISFSPPRLLLCYLLSIIFLFNLHSDHLPTYLLSSPQSSPSLYPFPIIFSRLSLLISLLSISYILSFPLHLQFSYLLSVSSLSSFLISSHLQLHLLTCLFLSPSRIHLLSMNG